MKGTKLREYIGGLSNKELWDLFDEMDLFEKTGVVGDKDELRLIARTFIGDNAMAAMNMMLVGNEVWRELAQRGAPYTM